MHDIKTIRDNPEAFKAALRRRGLDVSLADKLIELDEVRRKHITALQDMQARRNAASAPLRSPAACAVFPRPIHAARLCGHRASMAP